MSPERAAADGAAARARDAPVPRQEVEGEELAGVAVVLAEAVRLRRAAPGRRRSTPGVAASAAVQGFAPRHGTGWAPACRRRASPPSRRTPGRRAARRPGRGPREAPRSTQLAVYARRAGVGVHRARVEVALAPLHAEVLQRLHLLPRLDALRDHRRPEALAHVEDRLDDLLAHLLLVHVAHERDVDLQVRRLEDGHRLEPRVAGPHVVDREGEAEVGEGVHRLAVEVQVLDDLPLGDLERDVARGELGAEVVEDAAAEEARCRGWWRGRCSGRAGPAGRRPASRRRPAAGRRARAPP